MTDIGEAVKILIAAMEKDKKCDYKPDQTNWKCNLTGSSSTLGDYLENKPDAAKESDLSSSKWPSQAHHLIPHLTLAKHPVKKYLKADEKIFADTYYNVDHKNNGIWLPYASALPEWSAGTPKSKRELMFKIMKLSGLQLHQGPHSSKNDYGIGAMPYKQRVKQFLDKIKDNGVSHYAGSHPCEDCKGKKQANKYPPRANTVRFVDKASRLLKNDIKKNVVFVSRIAAEYAQTALAANP